MTRKTAIIREQYIPASQTYWLDKLNVLFGVWGKFGFATTPLCHFATLRAFALELAPIRQSSSKHDSALT